MYTICVFTDFNVQREIDIYVVAFNKSELIEKQIKFLKKFLAPNFTHIVIDNSFEKTESEKIRAICVEHDVSYFKVFKPKKIRGTYSASHVMAMNWTCEKFIKPRKRNFALIDHDIFPTCKMDVAEYVRGRELFGAQRDFADSRWFLWAGFAFFNWDYVGDKKLDFGRCSNFFGKHIGDTGSTNWNAIYHNYERSELFHRLRDNFSQLF